MSYGDNLDTGGLLSSDSDSGYDSYLGDYSAGDDFFTNDIDAGVFSWDSDNIMGDTSLGGQDFDYMFTEVQQKDPSLWDKAGDIASKVPDGVWNTLADFGVGWLGQWLTDKNKEAYKEAYSDYRGGYDYEPTEAVTSSIPVGTRK